MRVKHLVLVFACILVLVTMNAAAGDWEFSLTPYLWFSGLDAQVSSVPGQPPTDVNASFSDILSNLDFALFLAGDARKGRWGLATDLMYVNVEAGGDFPGPEFSTVDLTSKLWMVSGMGFYRLLDSDGTFIDGLVGVRYWDVTNDVFLGAGAYPDTLIENSDNWFDPMVGFRGRSPLGESKFSFGWHLMAGGFGVGSDMMWDILADFGYHWEKTAVMLGYRYSDVKYENGDFLFDASQDGPILGLLWRF